MKFERPGEMTAEEFNKFSAGNRLQKDPQHMRELDGGQLVAFVRHAAGMTPILDIGRREMELRNFERTCKQEKLTKRAIWIGVATLVFTVLACLTAFFGWQFPDWDLFK